MERTIGASGDADFCTSWSSKGLGFDEPKLKGDTSTHGTLVRSPGYVRYTVTLVLPFIHVRLVESEFFNVTAFYFVCIDPTSTTDPAHCKGAVSIKYKDEVLLMSTSPNQVREYWF